MSLRNQLLPTFRAIATGQTATCILELGKRYHVIWLELSDSVGTTLASGNLIGEIRLLVNGKVQRRMTGIELNALNSLNGTAYALKTFGNPGTAAYRTYLPIWLAEPWRKNPADVSNPAWNASGIDSLSIEVDLKSGLTSPNVTGFYEWDNPVGNLGAIAKWIRQTFGAVGTSQDIDTLTKRDFIQQISLFATSDGHYVNKVRLTAGGVQMRDLLDYKENQSILMGRELLPDSSNTPRFDVVFDYDDPINGALPTNIGGAQISELTLHIEYDAAANGSQVAIIQRAGAPE